MNRNRIIAIAVAAVAVVVIVGVAVLTKRSPAGNPLFGPGGAAAPKGPTTRQSIPQNLVVVVPGKNTTSVPEGVAVPVSVSPANLTGTSNYRNFNIKADGGKFAPDTINVYLNDQIVLNITAVDRDYDFTQPDFGYSGVGRISIPKGTTKAIHIQAPAVAKFTFYCGSCGGPASGPVGYINVVPKPQ